MIQESPQPELKHYLYPGALFVDSRPHLVTTVLGSCVAVCLWDSVQKVGGINHYLLPLWNGEGLSTPKYGNIAIEKLISGMLDLGCKKKYLVAKLFGGAALWQNQHGLLRVGDRNASLAQDILKEHNIPIVASDLLGEQGRKIIYNTETGAVLLRRHRSRVIDPNE
ncbi:MAG TPA: chemotaxis protein CheD [Geopsychrobacteraceae bacterium]|nr:chemotaxis protein CheD [Geopsychrobacteraceae bacterium]